MFESHTPLTSRPLRRRLSRRLAGALALVTAAVLPLAGSTTLPASAADSAARSADASPAGYWMVASDGGIFSFGDAKFFGSTGAIKLNQPIVGIAATPSGNGYWMVATDGGIFSFGDAKFFGSTGAIKLNKPIVGMAATPSGSGYWLVASDGGVFSFGDAKFFGSTGAIKLNKPIVGMASSPSGSGYRMVASDGGIFSFGDAKFFGSTGSTKLNQPITGMASTPSGLGYWLSAADGGIFSFGDAAFFGAAPSRALKQGPRTVAAMVPSPSGAGYWQASSSGELLAFGDAPDMGGVSKLARPIVGMTALPRTAVLPGTPGGPGPGPGTTPTSGPVTTPTTAYVPPVGGPRAFSSLANASWGTLRDLTKTKTGTDNPDVETNPYSQKVSAISEIGDRVFIGGEFKDLVSPGRPNPDQNGTPSGVPYSWLAALDTAGSPLPKAAFNATLDGAVRALLRSPDGRRLYVAGEFNQVNGDTSYGKLVALDPATGAIDPSFRPPEPNSYVGALALSSDGSRLYIGGAFSSYGPSATSQVAAIDTASGQPEPGFNQVPPHYQGKFMTHTGIPVDDPTGTDPAIPDRTTPAPNASDPEPGGTVKALALTADGQHLMVGGDFLHFGNQYDPSLTKPSGGDPDSENHKAGGLIALNPATGALAAWQPEHKRPVFGLAVWPGDGQTVFVAAGGGGGRLESFLPGNLSKVTYQWVGNVDGDAVAVAATNDWVYLVGHFDYEVNNPDAACLKNTTASGGYSCAPGQSTTGDPSADGITAHRHLVAFDARGARDSKGKLTRRSSVDPAFNAQADTSEGPYAVHIGRAQMYVGGNFTLLSPKPTRCPAGVIAPTPTCGRDLQVKQPGFAMYPPRP